MIEADPIVEFVVYGAPASVTWKEKGPRQRRNYKLWMAQAAGAARQQLGDSFAPLSTEPVHVTMVYVYRETDRDVDSFIKPALDGLGCAADPNDPVPAVVWIDDRIVQSLEIVKVRISDRARLEQAPPLVLRTIQEGADKQRARLPVNDEFLYVKVDRMMP